MEDYKMCDYRVDILDFQKCVERKIYVVATDGWDAMHKAIAKASRFEVVTDVTCLGPALRQSAL